VPVQFDEREEETEQRQTGLRRPGENLTNRHREAKATTPLLDCAYPETARRGGEFHNLSCMPDWGVGCPTAVSNRPFVNFFAVSRRLPPRQAPARWWGVIARIVFDANGNVLWKALGIDDGQQH
jgi:hypothetical protein